MSNFNPKEVQALGATMTSLSSVSLDQIEKVIDEFIEQALEGAPISFDESHVRNILNKALGEGRARHVSSKFLTDTDAEEIENLRWLDAKTIANLIISEHPQVIAAVIANLLRDQAGEVLKYLPDHIKSEVVMRVADIEAINPMAMKELGEVMKRMLKDSTRIKKDNVGGIRHAAELISYAGSSVEEKVLEDIRRKNPVVAEKLMNEMFIFDDLFLMDDRNMQILLRKVRNDQLAVALRGASPELKDKVFKNISSRTADNLREEMEIRGPVRLSEVKNEQRAILQLAHDMEAEGLIVMGGKSSEDALV